MAAAAPSMVFCCWICHEDLGMSTSLKPKEIKSLLTTKCGHLFHNECLHKFYSNNGDNIAWGSKPCPTCKTSLNIATDTVTIFPTNIEKPATVSPGPNIEELTARVNQLQTQIVELRSRLEISFLKHRESEKTIARYRADNEALLGKLNVQLTKAAEYVSQIEWLSTTNQHLKNTMAIMECHNYNRIRLLQPPFPPFIRPVMRPYFPPLLASPVGPRRSFPPPFMTTGNFMERPNRYPVQQHSAPATVVGFRGTAIDTQNLSDRFSQVVSLDFSGPVANGGSFKNNHIRNDNGSAAFEDSVMNEQTDTNSDISKSIHSPIDVDQTYEKDLNGNLHNSSEECLAKQNYWKYRCSKCDISWGNRGGQEPQRTFCHGCHKIVYPQAHIA